ncbi:MAG TPA: Xaa-Pro peptidase family protein, partial [Anaerolineaceae bacterium]|nr:Xaa-Pro peptidase family protein [Anaerolineaceae bacterium]
RFDAENVRRMGGYNEVIAYDEDFFPPLLQVLKRLNPTSIALNYSEHDVSADGLSHGTWLSLKNGLAGTPYTERLVSSEGLVRSLRGQKTPAEVERIRTAAQTTEEIVDEIGHSIKIGMNEEELYTMVQGLMSKRGLSASWDPCPNISVGAASVAGHTLPDARCQVEAGMLVHMDLGVRQNEYVSDMQRVWYVLRPGESGVPLAVQKVFKDVRGAIMAAAAVLRPGVEGWKVDEAARDYIIAAGHAEFQHATGHSLGRAVHDGGNLLGPRWPRYGQSTYHKVEAGNVFTLELGVPVPGYGFIGLEEDVLVLEDGLEWLSHPQEQIILITG